MNQGKKIPDSFWERDFLERLEHSAGSIAAACRSAGVTPQSYYNYRFKNPAFARKAEKILTGLCLPVLEDIARAKAIQGDNKILLFLLRNLGGDKWNKDLREAALAKELAGVKLSEEKNKGVIHQHIPTRAERAAIDAYLEALEEEKREEKKKKDKKRKRDKE
jgi:hypothetical protein